MCKACALLPILTRLRSPTSLRAASIPSLALQIEEHYISAAELGRLTGAPAELILRTELTALQVQPAVLCLVALHTMAVCSRWPEHLLLPSTRVQRRLSLYLLSLAADCLAVSPAPLSCRA